MRRHLHTRRAPPAPPAPGPGAFAWLEGATGARLSVVRDRRDRRTIGLAGEIDLASIDVIEAVVAEALERCPGRVALDLSGVSFLDPAAMAMVDRARALAADRRVPLLVLTTPRAGRPAPRRVGREREHPACWPRSALPAARSRRRFPS